MIETLTPRQMAENGDHEGALLALIQRQGDVTFHHVMSLFYDLINVTGGHSLSHPEFPSLVYWYGISEELTRLLAKLVIEKKIEFSRCSPGVYTIQNLAVPAMPLAEEMKQYDTPHWLPCFINVYGMAVSRAQRSALKALGSGASSAPKKPTTKEKISKRQQRRRSRAFVRNG